MANTEVHYPQRDSFRHRFHLKPGGRLPEIPWLSPCAKAEMDGRHVRFVDSGSAGG